MSTTYRMPTFGDITNIISTSVEKKDVNTYQAITWYEKAKTHYENAFRITEIEGLLIIEQKAKNKIECKCTSMVNLFASYSLTMYISL